MLSGHMLPIHFPPAPDELLSSWYVRLAHANQLKPETLNTFLWGRQRQVWNRDIDRMSPKWLVKELADRTGTAFDVAWNTTLRSYEGKLFPKTRQTGISPWILPVQMYHRKHKWPGLQFCPVCLKEDEEPYFRKRWRLAIYTACHRHNVLCQDRCPSCHEPVMFHRRGLGKTGKMDSQALSLCFHCNFDLRMSASLPTPSYENKSTQLGRTAIRCLEDHSFRFMNTTFYSVLHHVCGLLVSSKLGYQLQTTIIKNIGTGSTPLQPMMPLSPSRAFFDHGSVNLRHQVLHFAYWLLSDINNIKIVVNNCKININYLYKDIDYIPNWYRKYLAVLPHRDILKLIFLISCQ